MRSQRENAKRRGLTLRVLVALPLLFVPAVVVVFTPFAPDAELVFVGLIPSLLALLQGRLFALATAVVTAGVVVLVELANPSPVAAVVLMAAIGLGIGASALRGWQSVAAVVCAWPAVLLVSAPLQIAGAGWLSNSPGAALLAGAIALVGGLWTVCLGLVLLPDLPRSEPARLSVNRSTVYGLALAILLGAATFGVTTWGHGSMAGWILLTILVVARPGYADTWRRIVSRSVGTVAGGLAAAVLSLVVPVEAVLTAVGLVSLAVAILLQLKKASYAAYSVALTAAIVLLNSRGTDLFAFDIERVLFTIIGALLTAAFVTLLELVLAPRRGAGDSRRPSAKVPRP